MKALKLIAVLVALLFRGTTWAADPLDTWRLRYQTSPTDYRLVSIAYGNGQFVAV